MSISELLLPEFDEEMKKTRATLERVPADKPEFAPHPKSMPLGKLAPHVAQLASFGLSILTEPQHDFSAGTYKPLPLESAAQLVRVLDEGAANVRSALVALPDEAWKQNWKLLFSGSLYSRGPVFSLIVRCSSITSSIIAPSSACICVLTASQCRQSTAHPQMTRLVSDGLSFLVGNKKGRAALTHGSPFYPASSLPPKERCTKFIDISQKNISYSDS
jgi:hypothetical protein